MGLRDIISWTLSRYTKSNVEREDKPHYDPGRAFDVSHYDEITKCRLEHLRWMDLPVAGKSVIELGAGIGRMSEYFVEQACDLLCTDGRAENIAKLRELYPNRKAAVVDLATDELFQYGTHDIVFCYGLLYHVADVMGLINRAARVCKGMMLIDTVIAPIKHNVCYLIKENPKDVTQSICDFGSRPSPSYVITSLLLAGFRHVYLPTHPPEHPLFRYNLVPDLSHWRSDRLTREIFVASFEEICCERLVSHTQAPPRR